MKEELCGHWWKEDNFDIGIAMGCLIDFNLKNNLEKVLIYFLKHMDDLALLMHCCINSRRGNGIQVKVSIPNYHVQKNQNNPLKGISTFSPSNSCSYRFVSVVWSYWLHERCADQMQQTTSGNRDSPMLTFEETCQLFTFLSH